MQTFTWTTWSLGDANNIARTYLFFSENSGLRFASDFLDSLIAGCFCSSVATTSYWKREELVNMLPGHLKSSLLKFTTKED